jgi:hypothetical protein
MATGAAADSRGSNVSGMRAQAVAGSKIARWKSRNVLMVVAIWAAILAVLGAAVAYLLWPTWPRIQASLDAPTVPVTVAGVLFNVPPGAARARMQRLPGAHERMDLVFLWPSLAPPSADSLADVKLLPPAEEGELPPMPTTNDRLFVTITALGAVLPPLTRLRTIYPRYIEAQAAAGPDGLAIVPFRAGTPYEGEDLVYFADTPEQFYALCSRPVRSLPGTCTQDLALDSAAITLRFPRQWLDDWRNTAATFDRLMAQLHAPGK